MAEVNYLHLYISPSNIASEQNQIYEERLRTKDSLIDSYESERQLILNQARIVKAIQKSNLVDDLREAEDQRENMRQRDQESLQKLEDIGKRLKQHTDSLPSNR